MGKNDIYMKSYLSDKTRFTDLFNCIVGQGKELFAPEDMYEITGAAELVVKDNKNKELRVEKFRDIIMETKRGEKLILLAIENQEEIHYGMPVRSMLYDAINYTNQVQEKAKENKESKRLRGSSEYLSGLRKTDKLLPVITLVFYYGSEKWDGSINIHGLLDLDEEEQEQADAELLKKYIPNYHMNLIQASDLAGNNSFKTDLQWIIGMLKYKESKKELIQYVNEHIEFFGNLDENEFGAAKALLGAKSISKVVTGLNNTEQGGIDMCRALDEWYQDGVNEGRLVGRNEGRLLGRDEGRLLGRDEGRAEGEDRFRRLCLRLSESGKTTEIEKVLRDKEYCKELYVKYSL